jgi:hypothetical protein
MQAVKVDLTIPFMELAAVAVLEQLQQMLLPTQPQAVLVLRLVLLAAQ